MHHRIWAFWSEKSIIPTVCFNHLLRISKKCRNAHAFPSFLIVNSNHLTPSPALMAMFPAGEVITTGGTGFGPRDVTPEAKKIKPMDGWHHQKDVEKWETWKYSWSTVSSTSSIHPKIPQKSYEHHRKEHSNNWNKIKQEVETSYHHNLPSSTLIPRFSPCFPPTRWERQLLQATRRLVVRLADALSRAMAWQTSLLEPRSVLSRGVCGVTKEQASWPARGTPPWPGSGSFHGGEPSWGNHGWWRSIFFWGIYTLAVLWKESGLQTK